MSETVSIPDSDLIKQCLDGDSEAFGVLVTRYQDRLFNMLAKVTGSADEAAEIAQQAFVLAFRNLGSFRGRAAFYTWLYRIALNAMISEKRRNRRQTASIEAVREQAGVEPVDDDAQNRPSHAMELAEQNRQVQAALAELSEEFRVALVLKEIDGLKYEEIAEIVDCPIGTVRSRIHRARNEMREKLDRLLKQP